MRPAISDRSAPALPAFADILGGGDRRSIGRADEVANATLADASRLPELWSCLRASDPLVRMRAADALEKVSRNEPHQLVPYRHELLALQPDDGSKEVRWHLVAMAARLPMRRSEASRLAARLDRLVRTDGSRIVKVAALEGICTLSRSHPKLSEAANEMLAWADASPFPSLRARARALRGPG